MWKMLGIFAEKVKINHRIFAVHGIRANGVEDE
jgi:hypothetical protein